MAIKMVFRAYSFRRSGTFQLLPDIVYPTYLINGMPAEHPMEVTVKKGQKIRLRFINAAASTIFHVALQGHQMTVTHTDGQPVEPVEVDAIRIGMGERYDVLVTAKNPGVWQLAASVEGAAPQVRALFRYQGSTRQTPTATFAPPELKGRCCSMQCSRLLRPLLCRQSILLIWWFPFN